MTLVIELPPSLEEELTQEAERSGVPPHQHAQWLLWIASALLDRTNSTPVSGAVSSFLAQHSMDQEQAGRIFEQLVRHVQTSDVDGILVNGHQTVVWQAKYVNAAAPSSHVETSRQDRPSAMGKYAHLNWSSEDYARRKQEEIDLEDRRRP